MSNPYVKINGKNHDADFIFDQFSSEQLIDLICRKTEKNRIFEAVLIHALGFSDHDDIYNLFRNNYAHDILIHLSKKCENLGGVMDVEQKLGLA